MLIPASQRHKDNIWYKNNILNAQKRFYPTFLDINKYSFNTFHYWHGIKKTNQIVLWTIAGLLAAWTMELTRQFVP